jgi:hypothetical protein
MQHYYPISTSHQVKMFYEGLVSRGLQPVPWQYSQHCYRLSSASHSDAKYISRSPKIKQGLHPAAPEDTRPLPFRANEKGFVQFMVFEFGIRFCMAQGTNVNKPIINVFRVGMLRHHTCTTRQGGGRGYKNRTP